MPLLSRPFLGLSIPLNLDIVSYVCQFCFAMPESFTWFRLILDYLIPRLGFTQSAF
ncbi:hypothetical protein H1P_620034 [Hyella patelloides LEGE 07179]|uniref:Uncharacterized protein n=1 Tax=Hyella patelloides LEGE 07179 TaxID=945734 RepID=A0A563W1L1_9CYAN|nr:hypothetical protein H1P_620034 [Hyella patelloides LEGE 07179]